MYFDKEGLIHYVEKNGLGQVFTTDVVNALEVLHNSSHSEYEFLQSLLEFDGGDNRSKIISVLLQVKVIKNYKETHSFGNQSFTGIGTKEEIEALFIIAGIPTLEIWELKNKYWPVAYVEMTRDNPWWLVLTPYGLIELGPRKRVIHISWGHTPVRKSLTDRDVTKDVTYLHAYSLTELIETLIKLGKEFKHIEETFCTFVDSCKSI